MTTPIEELRVAAARLRDSRNCEGFQVACPSRELLEMIRVLLRAREPLAEFLDVEADVAAEMKRQTPAMTDEQLAASVHGALTIARAINGATEPGPGQDGHIEDQRSGRALYDRLMRMAGETP
ncbi:hypothetical protein [Streptomyces blattellae]|uniref:hypothetical protein n=1 Tax=Streptomyces blattellae TaxID=2569855 RepID=UPI0012B90A84|nr:hypothetical protein [Streptomyces blattellae]